MIITNREMQGKVQVLQTITQRKLPIKISYAIAKNINSINKELKIFEDEKMKIISDYTLKDKQGDIKVENDKYVFIKDKEDECNEKYNELLNIEVELNLRAININDLLNSNVDFTPGELIELDFMIME
ncbi:UNVERIFIED_ORG: hypothetical protein B2H93_14430 [Clostridium botulinum]